MTWLPILRLMGVLLLQLSVFMLIPALLMLLDREPAVGMLSAAGITALTGATMMFELLCVLSEAVAKRK